jgi:hypothetical protein
MTRKPYKALSILLSLVWMLSLTPALGVTAWAEADSAAAIHADAEKSDSASQTTKDPNAAAKQAAKKELDDLLAGKKEADYSEEDWATLNAVIKGGKDAIDAMKTAKGIETAKNTATEAAAAIHTKTQKAAAVQQG